MTLCYLTNKYEEDATLQEKVIEIEKKVGFAHGKSWILCLDTSSNATTNNIGQTIQLMFSSIFL